MAMAKAAAMTYLRVLREKQGMTQRDVAEIAKVESKQVYRWEKSESEPTPYGLLAFIKAVGGSPEQVTRLYMDENATEEDARQLALSWLEERTVQYINGEVDVMSDDELAAALDVVKDFKEKNLLREFIRIFRPSYRG